MPAPIDPAIKSQVKRAYVAGATIADLAEKFKISERSIERWSAAEHWDAERKADNVIEMVRQPQAHRPPPARDVKLLADAVEIADRTICGLEAELANCRGKDYASVASCLRAWVEYRDKIRPVTLDQLIDKVVQTLGEWELSPTDFVKGLRDRRAG
jgi:hypothetical protein